jgi:hypothetical protein
MNDKAVLLITFSRFAYDNKTMQNDVCSQKTAENMGLTSALKK